MARLRSTTFPAGFGPVAGRTGRSGPVVRVGRIASGRGEGGDRGGGPGRAGDRAGARRTRRRGDRVRQGARARPAPVRTQLAASCTPGSTTSRARSRRPCAGAGSACSRTSAPSTASRTGRSGRWSSPATRSSCGGCAGSSPGRDATACLACGGWTARRLREIEPRVAGVAALHSPTTAIVDYPGGGPGAGRRDPPAGGRVLLGAPVDRDPAGRDGDRAGRRRAEHRLDQLVVCAGLQSDLVARMAGDDADPVIVPFRGEYYRLVPERADLVRGLVYPVPDPRYPFLGVHFTRAGGRRPSTSGRTRCWPPPGRATGAGTWCRRAGRDTALARRAAAGPHALAGRAVRAARVVLQAHVRRPGPRRTSRRCGRRTWWPRRPACGPRPSTRTARWSTTSGSAGSARSSPSATRRHPAATSCAGHRRARARPADRAAGSLTAREQDRLIERPAARPPREPDRLTERRAARPPASRTA